MRPTVPAIALPALLIASMTSNGRRSAFMANAIIRNNDQITIHKSEAGKLLKQTSSGYNVSRSMLTRFFREELSSCHHYSLCPLSMELK
jgi:hypothetical protein